MDEDEIERYNKAKILQHTGQEPMRGEPICLLWDAEHDSCRGCPSELSCCRLSCIEAVMMAGMAIINGSENQSVSSFIKSCMESGELVGKIIEAKTVDEVVAVLGIKR